MSTPVAEGPSRPDRDTLTPPLAIASFAKGEFRRAYWLALPLLAVVAYVTVLRIGFLGDDFIILLQAERGRLLPSLLPNPDWFFYRPVGALLTWQLGWALWGNNPLPYHLLGLLAHAAVALSLGLWLAEASGRKWLGWLAGALFAVFPANTEAVGWLAAQWDAWAALFALLSLLAFTRWWRSGGWGLLALSAFLYGMGIFTKESLLAWLPIFPLVAWYLGPKLDLPALRRLALSMLPFAALLALNVGIRLSAWGSVGGYQSASFDYTSFIWDRLVAYCRALVAPLSSVTLGGPLVQIVGLLATLLLLAGLAFYGRAEWRLLAVSGAWVMITLMPVLNLPVKGDDLQNNRFLYLPSAGYCVGVAALLHAWLSPARRWQAARLGAVALVLFAGVAACWLQLRPWHTATVQTDDLLEELTALVPPQPRAKGLLFYLQNVPHDYEGAYLPHFAIGAAYYRHAGQEAAIQEVDDATRVDLRDDPSGRDAYALRFFYSKSAMRFHVDYAAGLASAARVEPPQPTGKEIGLRAWDFRGCEAGAVAEWQVEGAKPACERGKGLALTAPSDDAQMASPPLSLDPAGSGARFVRLRVTVGYPAAAAGAAGRVMQWYWEGAGQAWSEERSRTVPLVPDGQAHVYTAYIPTPDAAESIARLRFDPANAAIPATIQWVAADMVR